MPFAPILKSAAEAAPVIEDGVPLTSVGMTLDDFSSELLAMLGGRQDIDAPRLARWINAAYLDVATSLELSELEGSYGFTTVADQPYYLIPNAVYNIPWMSLADPELYQRSGGEPMRKRSIDWYRRQWDSTLYNNTVVPPAPTDFFEYKGVLVLWPTPTAAIDLAVDFQIRPAKLVETDDSPILPPEWHWAILLRARAIAHGALLEWEYAAPAQNDYVNYVRQRQDLRAAQDTGRTVLSSVPRTRRQLTRGSRTPITPHELDVRD